VSTWRARASAASVAGACVFATATGAGAVFVGDWWGQHHGPVVVEYANGPTDGSRVGTSPGTAGRVAARTRTSPGTTTAAPAQPDSDISKLSPRIKRGTRRALQGVTGRAAPDPPTVPVSTIFPAAPPGPVPTGWVPPSPVPTGWVPPSPVPTGWVPPSPVPTGRVPPSPMPTGWVPPSPVPTGWVPPSPVPTGWVPPSPMPTGWVPPSPVPTSRVPD
jgi:hypothetical protein